MTVKGAHVVATPAEIDITSVDRLRLGLLYAIRTGHPVVVADMTGTRFCDAAGARILIAANEQARADGSELRLIIPADGVVPRVFTLIGVDRVIPCFASLPEAVEAGTYVRDKRGSRPYYNHARSSIELLSAILRRSGLLNARH